MNLTAAIVIPENVLTQELEGETILLNLDTDTYHGLDDVGTRIWQLLNEHKTIGAVLNQMISEYDVSEDILRHDLIKLSNDLLEAGLLQLEPA